MKRSVQGFTLVELIVVIVILGILAATALPRFINVTSDARKAAVNGIAGGLNAASAVIQAKWFAAGATGSSVATADGQTVDTGAAGIPAGTAAGIGRAVKCEASPCQGMTISFGSPTTFQPEGGSATCQASYDPASGVATATVSGC